MAGCLSMVGIDRQQSSPFRRLRLPPWTIFLLLSHLIWVLSPVVWASPNVTVVPLSKANGTTGTVDDYFMKISLGQPAQDVYLVPSFYTPASALGNEGNGTDGLIFVLNSNLCLGLAYSTEWNPIINPSEDEIIDNDTNVYQVRWQATQSTESVNLSLRKGDGQSATNVTVIAMNLKNTGQYVWNVTRAYFDNKLGYAEDYSLMLWTDDPPRRSYSKLFALADVQDNDSLKKKKRAVADPPSQDSSLVSCLKYLNSNGGSYNQSIDRVFRLSQNGIGLAEDPSSAWKAQLSGTGYTTVSWTATDPSTGLLSYSSLSDIGVGLVKNASQGLGIVSLMDLQKKQAKDLVKSDVVGLYLGNADNPGAVTMGGYDKALIDDTNGAAAFVKMGMEFRAELSHITVVPRSGLSPRNVRTTELARRAQNQPGTVIAANISSLLLSYDSPNIRLPASIITQLLPLLGSPKYNADVGGYVYEGPPVTDYFLVFTLRNGSETVNITVPSSSLIVQESVDDNPATSHVESGKRYLLLTPIQVSDGFQTAYLGRAFLKNVYLVNDDSIGKFYMSGVNTTAATAGIRDVITGSTGILDSTAVVSPPPYLNPSGNSKDKSGVGAIVGGILGGLGTMAILFLVWYLSRRVKKVESMREKDHEALNEPPIRVPSKVAFIPVPNFPESLETMITPPNIAKGKERNPEGITSAFIIDTSSKASSSRLSMELEMAKKRPPTPPMKDELYMEVKRSSQPTSREGSPLDTTRGKQSVPVFLPGATSGPDGCGDEYYQAPATDWEEERISKYSAQTYSELLQRRQANKWRTVDEGSTNSSSGTETATVGRVISRGQVAKVTRLSITPPDPVLVDSLERRASLGRVLSPTEIIVPSRRSSRGIKGSLGRTKCRSLGGLNDGAGPGIGGGARRSGSVGAIFRTEGEDAAFIIEDSENAGLSRNRKDCGDFASSLGSKGHSRHSSMPILTSPELGGSRAGVGRAGTKDKGKGAVG